jgi:hypothetical protein
MYPLESMTKVMFVSTSLRYVLAQYDRTDREAISHHRTGGTAELAASPLDITGIDVFFSVERHLFTVDAHGHGGNGTALNDDAMQQ